jgi:hypothetical protein
MYCTFSFFIYFSDWWLWPLSARVLRVPVFLGLLTSKTGSQLRCLYIHSLCLAPCAINYKIEKIRESSQFFLNILYFTNMFFSFQNAVSACIFDIIFNTTLIIVSNTQHPPPPPPLLFPKLKTNLECCMP